MESPRLNESQLKIEKLVYGGDGLARSESGVVLTPFVLPGEIVRVELRPVKNDLSRGRLLEILEPAPWRADPPCSYFGRCGGCQYQHAAYEYQIEQKRAILREALRRTGKIEFEGEIGAIAGPPWQYRNRAQLHIQDGLAGYFGASSREVVPIEQCPISSPKLNDAIAILARELPRNRRFSGTVELFTNETEVQVNVADQAPASVRRIVQTIGGAGPIEYGNFRVSRNSFFQVNRFLIDKLVETALAGAEGETALDLYAGVGLFTAALAGRFRQVAAVESGASAFHDLEFNMRRAGLLVRCGKRSSEEYLADLAAAPDFILADPPRAGLGKLVVRELLRLHPRQLTVISCDPATLARDLTLLLGAGYRIECLTLVDLFPQTCHLETVARLMAH